MIPLWAQFTAAATNAARLSAWNFCNSYDNILPSPDGTVGALDRQHLWGLSSTISITAPVKWVTQTPNSTSYTTQAQDTTSYTTQTPDSSIWTTQAEDS